ncbi:MAG TPA: fused MFS/spermidine synthase [Gemmataceae bacterium]|nr:fused MFS/spermidine synthase [Gemmataceae bacterium]
MSNAADARSVSAALLTGLGSVVFLANAGLLVLQLLAGRFLAPFIGSSVETWTSVIGVFLTGIALGNHIGGRIADRSPSTRTLGILLVLGGLSSLSMILLWVVCQSSGFDRMFGLGPRIPVLAALFCLPPAFVLSLITPLTIKLMLPDVTKAGRIAGLVFALSTLGCLVGNYATGFWLMANYTLNTITVGVAAALFLMAIPMFLVGYRLTPAAIARADAATAPAAAAEDPLGFKKDIRRAFAVVFIASFCGMSLELTASRVLAPVLGVSLYSWTGIIGVMLAGTACGNYLGGVLADRGAIVGLQRFALLIGAAIGFAAGPAFVRTFRLDGYPFEDSPELWTIRVVGVVVGLGLVAWVVRYSGQRAGQFMAILGLGAAIGFAAAHPVVRSFGRVFGGADISDAFAETNASVGFDVGSLVVHLLGAATGGVIALGLLYEPEKAGKPASRQTTLTACLFAGGVFAALVVLLAIMFQNPSLHIYSKLTGSDIVWNILTWTFLLFFLPMLCLGTVSPQVIRLSIADTAHAGRVAGTIYAWSTVGAIVGTFATGYFLIGWIGMYRVLFAVALVLMVLTMFLGRLWTKPALLYGGSIVLGVGVVGMVFFGFGRAGFDMETKYYAIKVSDVYEHSDDVEVPKYKTLALDLLVHSYVKPWDPTWLGYEHEQIQCEITRYYRSQGRTGVLVIGGGGYTYPRWVEHVLPDVEVDVVEIDPGVTEMAHRELGLSRETRIRSHHMDGRQFVRERAPTGHYQLVVQDAVNDLSVPYHLMTKEYNDAVKETLAPGGAYLLTLIDSIEEGELWRAAVATMRQTFAHVELLDPENFQTDSNGRITGRHVYVIYGADHALPLADIRAVAREARVIDVLRRTPAADLMDPTSESLVRIGQWMMRSRSFCYVLAPDRLERHVNARPAVILTDQYAPVDNLMSSVFRERSRVGH